MARRVAYAAIALLAGAAIWLLYPQPEEPSGEPMVDVTVPALDATAQAGEIAFNQYCAGCHGGNAAGRDGIAPPLVHKIYEPGHHGDQSFVIAAKRGVRAHHWSFGDMPPVDGITDEEVVKIVAYVRALQRANGI